MKKILLLLGVLLIGSCTFAEEIVVIRGVNMDNFWKKKGIDEQKVILVGQKIMLDNKIAKRVPIWVDNKKTINAYSRTYDKIVIIHEGMFFYIDNDDELAYVLSHEIAHSVEAYGGMMKYMAVNANSKKYEQKADLNGIDYMVKAGYDPIAAITMGNKIFAEPVCDWGFTSTHPKGSKRLMDMYKYIYVKYPHYLNSPLTKSPSYKNFEYSMAKEIREFQQKQKRRQLKQQENI
ncbi:TPA: hypothetical protein CPT81_03290 [Candidatus Gastranaerophilales bacterium HUM_20]|nr:peptidase family M48 [Clostridium sp. CAG:729]DAB22750.1 MAG TPA: hypothetical protein CPT81_03290 [Candidatus Gastranaerophilales bacterium HUM_20]